MNNYRSYALLIGTFLTLAVFPSNLGARSSELSQGGEYQAFAEEMPSPVGGMAAIYGKIKYPEVARRAGISGKVFVLAYINEHGTVEQVKVLRGIGAGCDEAAEAAIKRTRFTPARSKGQAVRVKLSLTIKFQL